MSSEAGPGIQPGEGVPELTQLGKRLEILRIERGVSKQRLARHAGTSRQQLWRVMTGKSELTSSLRERLAFALSVEAGVLKGAATSTHGSPTDARFTFGQATVAAPVSAAEYLSDSRYLVATLRTLPSGDAGRQGEALAVRRRRGRCGRDGTHATGDYSDIHRRVLTGEL